MDRLGDGLAYSITRGVFSVAPLKELRVHLGAHKTATTHLQDTLFAHRAALRRCDLDYIPRDDFGPLQRRYSNPDRWRKKLWSPPIERLFLTQFEALRNGPSTVLLSDEDLLGFSYDLFSRPIYADLRGLHTIRSLASKDTTLCLFLGIRSFEQIIPSAYAQTIKAIHPKPGWLTEIRQSLLETPPSWANLIERLTEMFPTVELRVWLQEDYRAHSQEILSFFVGANVGRFPDLPPPVRTTSPSRQAIEAAEKLDGSLSMQERRERVWKLYYDELPAGEGRSAFDPLNAEEKARLREHYRIDVETIEKRWPRMIFRPQVPS